MASSPRTTIAIHADVHAALIAVANREHTSLAHLVEVACIDHYSLPLESRTRLTYIRDKALAMKVNAVKRQASHGASATATTAATNPTGVSQQDPTSIALNPS